jgi:methylthioribulose-1-phosphate dehydratase
MFNEKDLALTEELIDTIRFFSNRGWTPATSTNYSVRSKNPLEFIISRSGVDKSRFTYKDLILINPKGEILAPLDINGLKSSAETEIHTHIYERYPTVNCVLHTHSMLGTVLSKIHQKEGHLRLEGLELLKALEGNETHEMVERLPIVPNSQDIPEILRSMDVHFNENPKLHGFLIAGHGLYTWGKDIATAKRHIEAYEFLFECIFTMRSL